MGLDEIKKFLKVDFDDDDAYILLLHDAAVEYITDAVGKCDEDSARVRMLMLSIIAVLYENRAYTAKDDEKVQYTLRSMVRQLQLGEV